MRYKIVQGPTEEEFLESLFSQKPPQLQNPKRLKAVGFEIKSASFTIKKDSAEQALESLIIAKVRINIRGILGPLCYWDGWFFLGESLDAPLGICSHVLGFYNPEKPNEGRLQAVKGYTINPLSFLQ